MMRSLVRNPNPHTRNDVACQVCDQSRTRSVYLYNYNNASFDLLECHNCGHLFIFPIPLAKLTERNLDCMTDIDFSGNNFLKYLHENLVINKEIRHVKRFLTRKNPRMLDIGCGTGWTTSLWQNKGFVVTGLEPSPRRSQYAREKFHLDVSTDYLENYQTKETFDVIVLRHLFEHIAEPSEMLKKVRSFLKPDGILVIVLPNINSIGRYLYKENWTWMLPKHLHFYNEKTLTKLLEKHRYEKLMIYQMPSPLWHPNALNRAFFGEDAKTQLPLFVLLSLCLPVVALGALLNLNDNMTLIFRNGANKD